MLRQEFSVVSENFRTKRDPKSKTFFEINNRSARKVWSQITAGPARFMNTFSEEGDTITMQVMGGFASGTGARQVRIKEFEPLRRR